MRRLFLTGERFSSDYAQKIGLIDFVFTEDEIEKKIQKYIDMFRSSGPNAIIEIKKLADACERMDRDTYIEHTIEKIAELRVSDEGQEGINAFLNKRKSKWSG
jgi:methylglutaconyl-CoA hydratase